VEQLRKVADSLAALGHEVELVSTIASGTAGAQAKQAVLNGAEVVFACGGDGTIHEVLQGLIVDANQPGAALGILPLGSANALARHLRLSLDPVQAALQQIHGVPCAIPVGKLVSSGQTRYFVLMAGAGPDGALVYNLPTTQKSKLGRLAYYLRAARLFATRSFSPFRVEYSTKDGQTLIVQNAVSVMAVRVDDLGGLFGKLTSRKASIHNTELQLIILREPAFLSMPLWFISGWLNLHRFNPFLQFLDVRAFLCSPIAEPAPHMQADGEWLGQIPMQVSLVPDALRILIPAQASPPKHKGR
jgi:YegS/Rv2252/BmrU family lipid kinase